MEKEGERASESGNQTTSAHVVVSAGVPGRLCRSFVRWTVALLMQTQDRLGTSVNPTSAKCHVDGSPRRLTAADDCDVGHHFNWLRQTSPPPSYRHLWSAVDSGIGRFPADGRMLRLDGARCPRTRSTAGSRLIPTPPFFAAS